MNLEALESYLAAKKGACKEFPFGEEAMVYKVAGKMFALAAHQETPLRLTLKATPEDALGYRAIYPCVREGYYMNKKHWNTVTLDGTMEDRVLERMIDESYGLVVAGLSKKERAALEE
ncbi:MAG: MmcQ/YjbR family DNA-binding protein [Campylobacterales bacterium]|nr:MmcQ/YjbR family DNA-binding protein [Campylobacterales bacterium]